MTCDPNSQFQTLDYATAECDTDPLTPNELTPNGTCDPWATNSACCENKTCGNVLSREGIGCSICYNNRTGNSLGGGNNYEDIPCTDPSTCTPDGLACCSGPKMCNDIDGEGGNLTCANETHYFNEGNLMEDTSGGLGSPQGAD